MNIYVNYEQHTVSEGDVCKGQENDPWPSYEDSYESFKVTYVSLKNDTPFHEVMKWDGDTTIPNFVFVVWVEYYSGGTFRTTHGYGSIEAVVDSYKKAEEIQALIKNDKWKSPHGGLRWSGYFCGIDDVHIATVMVDRERYDL
jgi:hypothetical protein